jgi:putative ABC transport system substrate-binding protein
VNSVIDRRKFIGAISGFCTWPLFADARPSTQWPRLGILRLSPPRASYENAFVQSLRDVGYVEGENLTIDDRHAGGDPDRLPMLAAELVQLPVTVIFARGAQALAAAKRATSTIPIVAFDDVTDPVASGYAASLARPGGNVTGVFVDMPELVGKWLELLNDVAPRFGRVAVLWDPTAGTAQREAVRTVARVLAIEVQLLEVSEASTFASAFATARRVNVAAVLVLSSPLMRINSKLIADAVAPLRIPSVSPYRDFPEAGGLMSFGPSLPEWFKHCGVQLGKILQGVKASALPIERPHTFELVLNSKTAKTLGIAIPQSLQLRANEVIQ